MLGASAGKWVSAFRHWCFDSARVLPVVLACLGSGKGSTSPFAVVSFAEVVPSLLSAWFTHEVSITTHASMLSNFMVFIIY